MLQYGIAIGERLGGGNGQCVRDNGDCILKVNFGQKRHVFDIYLDKIVPNELKSGSAHG